MVDQAPLVVGWPELGLTGLATIIVFYFLGGRLLRDYRDGKFR